METNKIIMVPLESLRPAPWNPPQRTTRQALKELQESIRARGIIVPLVIDTNGNVIDGHRRLACAKALGLQVVPAVVVQADSSLYSELNDVTRRLNGKEWLHVFARGVQAGKAHNKHLVEIERLCGREMIERMRRENLSSSVYKVARAVCRYTGTDPADDKWMRTVITWIVEGHRQAMAHWAMADGIKPQRLYEVVRDGRDIRRRYLVT